MLESCTVDSNQAELLGAVPKRSNLPRLPVAARIPEAPLAKRGALLKGHTIAVDSINSMIHAYVRLVATRSGFNPDDIRIAGGAAHVAGMAARSVPIGRVAQAAVRSRALRALGEPDRKSVV